VPTKQIEFVSGQHVPTSLSYSALASNTCDADINRITVNAQLTNNFFITIYS